ncbi:MAG: type II toxin-antitoxin system ParD family antitoxin [Pseudomonadota bacterium]
MNISLGERFERLVADFLASGRYASQSEVVREGLRLLEEREARLHALRSEIERGRASGDAVAYDPERIKRRGRERKGDT